MRRYWHHRCAFSFLQSYCHMGEIRKLLGKCELGEEIYIEQHYFVYFHFFSVLHGIREKIHIFFLSAYCRLIWGLLEQMVPLVCALRSPNICHRFGIHKGIMLVRKNQTSIIFSWKHFWFQYSILILIKISDVNIAELILVN